MFTGLERMFPSDSESTRIASSRLRIVCGAADGIDEVLTTEEALRIGNALLGELGIEEGERVVLLLLPHSRELFCLHLALVFGGNVPAILPWPTSRVDAAKYQRNLVHQLQGLPAARLITLPKLAENLGEFLGFPASGLLRQSLETFEAAFAEKFDCSATEPRVPIAKAAGGLPDGTLFFAVFWWNDRDTEVCGGDSGAAAEPAGTATANTGIHGPGHGGFLVTALS